MSGVQAIVNTALVVADAANQARRRTAKANRDGAISTARDGGVEVTNQAALQVFQNACDTAQRTYLAALQTSEMLRQSDVNTATSLARGDTAINAASAALFGLYNGT